jgi:hypothetical protein
MNTDSWLKRGFRPCHSLPAGPVPISTPGHPLLFAINLSREQLCGNNFPQEMLNNYVRTYERKLTVLRPADGSRCHTITISLFDRHQAILNACANDLHLSRSAVLQCLLEMEDTTPALAKEIVRRIKAGVRGVYTDTKQGTNESHPTRLAQPRYEAEPGHRQAA